MVRFIVLVGLYGSILFGGLTCIVPEFDVPDYLHVYLTWQQTNTTDNMTVNFFHSKKHAEEPILYYDILPKFGFAKQYTNRVPAKKRPIKGLDKNVYYVELTNLDPGKTYYFSVGSENFGPSPEYRFRTPHPNQKSLTFVTGGDAAMGITAKTLLTKAASHSPDFALLGGDISYANGKFQYYDRWVEWLSQYQERMITPEGWMIPMVVAVGNHEVKEEKKTPEQKAPFYFGLFGQNGDKSFFSRTFRNDIAIYILDSDHVYTYGDQVAWLGKEMARHNKLRNKMAIYHKPLYPTHRQYDAPWAQEGRKQWLPLFDQFGLKVAFENHDHTHKRTKLLRNNKIVNKNGTLFLGDGCLGMIPRTFQNYWYLERVSSTPHFWLIRIDDQGISGQAIKQSGEAFDEFLLPS